MSEKGYMTVRATKLVSGETVEGVESDENITVRSFRTVPARVVYEGGGTFQTRPYESVRVNVRVEVPCYLEEVEDVYNQVRAFVEEKIEIEVKEILKIKEM